MKTERRAAARTRFTGGVLPPTARLLPARDVILVDLSRNGALVEGVWRLRPGGRAELQIGLGKDAAIVRGRVERCYVASLGPSAVRYRAAVRFDSPISVPAPRDPLEGYVVPGREEHVPKSIGHGLPDGR
ncbi:MAG TPA: hypothetical protein VNK41_11640 [Vicinamibacterales bacterium]|nr:hypothetical protein [Vicinamibacterales bacterium]